MAENRCPGAKFLCTAFIEQYVFKFNKKSTLGIGSGKGNIIFTSNSSDVVDVYKRQVIHTIT